MRKGTSVLVPYTSSPNPYCCANKAESTMVGVREGIGSGHTCATGATTAAGKGASALDDCAESGRPFDFGADESTISIHARTYS